MDNKPCAYCWEDITKEQRDEGDSYMVAIDSPYVNIFFHKTCLPKLEEEHGQYPEGYIAYLPTIMEKWYNTYENRRNTRKNRRK